MSSSKLQELNKLYSDGETADKELWAEQRSHILLISGDHYQKRNRKWMTSIRESQALSDEQKIRIMKNHTNRIYNAYVNRYTSIAPGTAIGPQNEKELNDIKAADLHKSVWIQLKERHNFREKVAQWAGDYVGIGECWVRIAWDWEKGRLKGTEEEPLPVRGDNEGAAPEMQKKYIFSGDLDYRRIFAFNVFRPKGCQDLDQAPWIGIRYMEEIDKLEREAGDDESLKLAIKEDGKTSYMVFDGETAEYANVKGQILVKEVYYRPSPEYPKGYFYKYITGKVLAEGELPEGIFPLVYAGYDSVPTSCRFRAPIKQWKPYQVEINRMASKMAEHQVTLGDDKVVMMNGGKLSNGGNHPGIRGLTATGSNVTVIPGRTGEQYLGVYNNTVQEYYSQAMVAEELDDKMPAQVDPYALLMQSGKWKVRNSKNIERFERFLRKVTEVSLELHRAYVEEDEVIQMIGKGEAVNLTEYKNHKPLGYQISLEPSSDDIETKMGKKLALDRYIQYAGANMQKEDIGKFLRMDPYLAKEQIFSDFTMEYDNATNDILALDRGQNPIIAKYRYPDPGYIVKRLTSRMGQSDFIQMPPQVQMNYEKTVQQYQQMIQQMAQEQAALNADMIPTDGPLVRTDFWVPSQKDPAKQERLALPSSTLLWVWDRIQKQGMTMDVLQQQQQSVVSDIARNIQANKQAMAAQSGQAVNGMNNMPAFAQRFFAQLHKQQ